MGLPGKAITQEYNSWEHFVASQERDVFRDLQRSPLPSALGQRTVGSGKEKQTWYENLGITNPQKPMNDFQARQATKLIIDALAGDYVDARTEVSDTFLKANPEQICILEYWEFRPTIKKDLRAYGAMCGAGGYAPWERP